MPNLLSAIQDEHTQKLAEQFADFLKPYQRDPPRSWEVTCVRHRETITDSNGAADAVPYAAVLLCVASEGSDYVAPSGTQSNERNANFQFCYGLHLSAFSNSDAHLGWFHKNVAFEG